MIFKLKLNHNFYLRRFYSQKQRVENVVKYTSTINLPKTDFPARLSQTKRKEVEKTINEKLFTPLYAYQRENNFPPEFVLHDGPPYANGDLHVGHAVNKILKDITLRHHVVNKKKVHYKPGWDCHGLPIELKAHSETTNISPLKIRQHSREFALAALEIQKNGFQSWGVMGDFNNSENIYKTIDSKYILNQMGMFYDLYQKELVYRDLKPIYWSPSSGTALAEAELEYDQSYISPSIMLRLKLSSFPDSIIKGNVFAIVWTTTPWTLPSNEAICFSPLLNYSLVQLNNDSTENNYYILATDLIEEFQKITEIDVKIVNSLDKNIFENVKYVHPFDGKDRLFLPASHVQATKGTGLVHTAPAHGPEDFLVSLEHKIPITCYVNEKGTYTDEAPELLRGKSVLENGNKTVLKFLQNDLIHSAKIIHSYPIDWRTKKPVIIRASKQWFINTEKLKSKAIEEAQKFEIYPKASAEVNRNALILQLQKRPYWCISRQRSWGVPIPVFYEKSSENVIMNERIIDHISNLIRSTGNIDFWWSKEIHELLPVEVLKERNLDTNEIEKGKDIFDIWFDSGISWSVVLDGLKVADLYLEGHDQLTGWFQSSLMTSVAQRGIAPYKSIFVHGFTVDEKGYKMSKSLGNVIAPNDIIKKHGIDVMRWWVASHGCQHAAIMISENLLKGCAENLAKIRGILKFFNGVIGKKSLTYPEVDLNELQYLDKYILNELYNFHKEIQDLYNSYEYNRVSAVILNFLSNQVSSIYLNMIKDRLYCGTDEEYILTQSILRQCYFVLCKVLWPLIPFLVEESWSYYDKEDPFYKSTVVVSNGWPNGEIQEIFNLVFNVRQTLHKKMKDLNSWTLELKIQCSEEDYKLLKKLHPDEKVLNGSELCSILQVSNVLLEKWDSSELDITYTEIKGPLCPRCRRYTIDLKDTVCERCTDVLANKQ